MHSLYWREGYAINEEDHSPTGVAGYIALHTFL